MERLRLLCWAAVLSQPDALPALERQLLQPLAIAAAAAAAAAAAVV